MRKECINAINSKAGRELSKSEIESIEEQFRAAYKTLARKDRDAFDNMSQKERYEKATEIAKERMIQGRVEAHIRQLKNAQKINDFISNVKALPKNKAAGWFNKFLRNTQERVDAISEDILSKQYTKNPEFFHLLQDEETANKIIAVAKDGADYPEYKKHAASLKAMMDDVHRQLNAAGIHVNYNERFLLPQTLDSTNVGSRSLEEFVKDMRQHLHPDTFMKTNGTFQNEEQITKILTDIYYKIKAGFDPKVKEGDDVKLKSGRRSAFDNSRNATREFDYKDAASLRFIREKYGVHADVNGTFFDYISRASRDIALTRDLGTDPRGLFEKALSVAKEIELKTDKALSVKEIQNINKKYNKLSSVFKSYIEPNKPGSVAWANFGKNVRTLTSLATTGDVSSALPDLAAMKVMFGANNLPFMKAMRDFLKFAWNGKDAKMQSQNLAMIPEELTGHIARYSSDIIKPNLLQKLSPIHHMLSGLQAFDRGLKMAIRRAVFNTLGKITREHATLDAAMAKSTIAAELNMKQSHYDVMRAAELDKGEDGEHTFITPDKIREVSDDKIREILAQNKEGSDTLYGKIIKNFNQKINDVFDKIQITHDNHQGFKQKMATIFDSFLKRTEKSFEKNQELKDKRISLYNEKLDLMDLNNDLEKKLLSMKKAQGLDVSKLLQAIYNGTELLKTKSKKLVYDAQGTILNFKNDSTDTGNARLFKETGKLTDAIGQKVDKVTDLISKNDLKLTDKNNQFTDDVLDTAIKYINNRAKMQERIKKLESDIDLITKKEKIKKRKDQIQDKINDNFDELKIKLDKHDQEIKKLTEYMSEYEKQRYRASDKDVQSLRDETSQKLIELAFHFQHQMGRGASRPDIVEQHTLGLHLPAGTLAGEMARYALQFKQIPVGILFQHWKQMGQIEGNFNKAKYAMSAAAWMTVAGAISGQIKAIAKGQDLNNMDPRTKEGQRFLLESFIRGGVLGIVGDLTLGTTGDLIANMAGPVAGIVKRADNERLAALKDVTDDKPSKHSYMQGAWGVGGRLIPFSNISYVKSAWNNMFYNRIADWIQPGYSDKKEAKYQRHGTSFYWPLTKALPQRLPDLSTAFGGNEQ